VLVHHPDDAAWFENPMLLPDLRRSHAESSDPGTLRLVQSDALTPGLALLDAPDIDSVDEHNRALATELLGAADMWIFVTSAARYADQVPWEYLHQAADRSVSVAVVLDRTQPQAVEEVRAHLARMLTSRGLRDAPLFAVPESELLEDGLLPEGAVTELRSWLREFATNVVLRQEVADETLRGAIRQLTRQSHAVADEALLQVDRSAALAEALSAAYEEAESTLLRRLRGAEIVRGEVLARWSELVGSGALQHSLDSRFTRIRDRLRGITVPSGAGTAEVALEAVDEGIRLMIVDEIELTAQRVSDITEAAAVADATEMETLSKVSHELITTAGRAVQEWQRHLTDLVTTAVKGGATPGRLESANVPALCLAVTILVATSSLDASDTTRGADATRASARAREIGEAVLGANRLEAIVAESNGELEALVTSVVGVERTRAESAVARLGASSDAATELRSCARRLDDLRFAAQLPPDPLAASQSVREW
jgi:hypothetical protein